MIFVKHPSVHVTPFIMHINSSCLTVRVHTLQTGVDVPFPTIKFYWIPPTPSLALSLKENVCFSHGKSLASPIMNIQVTMPTKRSLSPPRKSGPTGRVLVVREFESESEVTQSCPTPWTVAYQAPLSMGFSRQ